MISQEELPHTEKCFIEINGYLKWLLKQTFDLLKPTTNILTKTLTTTTMLILITYLTNLTYFKVPSKDNYGII